MRPRRKGSDSNLWTVALGLVKLLLGLVKLGDGAVDQRAERALWSRVINALAVGFG